MSLPYRCSTRALRELRRIPGSLLCSKRGIPGVSYRQRRGRYSPSFDSRRAPAPKLKTEYPEAHVEYVKVSPWDPIHPAYLRDSCTCAKCVDPSSKQKHFQTTDIPKDIKAGSVKISPDDGTVEIVWENDIPGFGAGHKSIFPREFFHIHSTSHTIHKSRFGHGKPTLWNKKTITRELEYVKYDEYMNTDEGLYRALRQVSSL
jgi:hypothetical protein